METTPFTNPVNRDTAVKELNDLLHGEIAAVDTYRIAIDKLRSFAHTSELGSCLASHEERVTKLKGRIVELGGTPETTGGAWGIFAKIVEGSAAMISDDAALKALEEGEDRGIAKYRDTGTVDPAVRTFVEVELLPLQLQTHSTMSQVKRGLQRD